MKVVLERVACAIRSEPVLRAVCTPTNAVIALIHGMFIGLVAPQTPYPLTTAFLCMAEGWIIIVVASSREALLHWQAAIDARHPEVLLTMQNDARFVGWMLERVMDETLTGLTSGRISPYEVDEATRYTFVKLNTEYQLWLKTNWRVVQCLITAYMGAYIYSLYVKSRRVRHKK